MPATRRLALAAALALPASLIASRRALARPAPLAGTTAQGRRFLAGGVDSDEAELNKALSAEFPLTVLLTAMDGAYLGDARIRVVDERGAAVVDAHVNAPCLLVDLSPGTYEIEATHANMTQRRRVQIGRRARANRVPLRRAGRSRAAAARLRLRQRQPWPSGIPLTSRSDRTHLATHTTCIDPDALD